MFKKMHWGYVIVIVAVIVTAVMITAIVRDSRQTSISAHERTRELNGVGVFVTSLPAVIERYGSISALADKLNEAHVSVLVLGVHDSRGWNQKVTFDDVKNLHDKLAHNQIQLWAWGDLTPTDAFALAPVIKGRILSSPFFTGYIMDLKPGRSKSTHGLGAAWQSIYSFRDLQHPGFVLGYISGSTPDILSEDIYRVCEKYADFSLPYVAHITRKLTPTQAMEAWKDRGQVTDTKPAFPLDSATGKRERVHEIPGKDVSEFVSNGSRFGMVFLSSADSMDSEQWKGISDGNSNWGIWVNVLCFVIITLVLWIPIGIISGALNKGRWPDLEERIEMAKWGPLMVPMTIWYRWSQRTKTK